MNESQLLLREGKKIVEALGLMFAPLVEVVLHDLTTPGHSIVAIANNLSGRQIGDATTEIGLARMADPAFPAILQNYANHFPDGRPAKSTSIGLKNSQGVYVAAICLNMDSATLNAAVASMAQLTQLTTLAVTENLLPASLDRLQREIEQFAATHNTTPRGLRATQRRALVSQLAAAGLMDLKNAQALVAERLGVARSTVYSYLPKDVA